MFEIKEVRAIKAKNYGDAYIGIADLVIVNGELSVEGLLFKENEVGTIADMREIEYYITTALGFNEYFYIRYKNGEKKKIKKVVK